jgi:outer membrane protein OmpA-like peptidoglycan-associated protein
LNSLSDKEKDNYKPLTGKEAETLEYICYVKATLLNYAKNENSLKPKTALKYWKQICDKFKPKYEKDESEDESVINTTPTVGKIYGCFDSTSPSYWCKTNTCPEGLDDSDFTGISNRVDIGGTTYIHTGCTYEETIVLENTYEFAGPGKTFDAGSYTIKAKRKNTLKRIREKIENSQITGSYPPISNAPGFYNNKFNDERLDSLREDLNDALVLILSRHCMKGYAIPRELTIYEGSTKSMPLGQFNIEQKNGNNCISNFVGLQAWESGEMLQIRLKQLMFDELDEENGTEHKVPENIIVKFNSYINGKLSEDGKDDDIIIDRNGNLKLESLNGLSKILENKPIGLAKLIK